MKSEMPTRRLVRTSPGPARSSPGPEKRFVVQAYHVGARLHEQEAPALRVVIDQPFNVGMDNIDFTVTQLVPSRKPARSSSPRLRCSASRRGGEAICFQRVAGV